METYSITFELYGERMRTHKDPIINIARNNRATLIDVVVSVGNGVDYTIKISFSDEQTLNKFIHDVREYLENT